MYKLIEQYQNQPINFERKLKELLAAHDPFQVTQTKYTLKDLDDIHKTEQLVARALWLRERMQDV